LGCYCSYYGKGKDIGWYVQVEVGKAVDEYGKNASHCAKGKASYLTAWIF